MGLLLLIFSLWTEKSSLCIKLNPQPVSCPIRKLRKFLSKVKQKMSDQMLNNLVECSTRCILNVCDCPQMNCFARYRSAAALRSSDFKPLLQSCLQRIVEQLTVLHIQWNSSSKKYPHVSSSVGWMKGCSAVPWTLGSNPQYWLAVYHTVFTVLVVSVS